MANQDIGTAIRDLKAAIDIIQTLFPPQKSAYDYLVVILPVFTGIAGWFFSAWWQNRQAKKNNDKEQYYHVRDKAEELLVSYSDLLDFSYSFYKGIKNGLNAGDSVTEDQINDFVTTFQLRLAKIHQSQRLMFPGKILDTRVLVDASNQLTTNISEMSACIAERERILQEKKEPPSVFDAINKRIADLNAKNLALFDTMTKGAAQLEDAIIEACSNKAQSLGIH